jgi:peptide deformylase
MAKYDLLMANDLLQIPIDHFDFSDPQEDPYELAKIMTDILVKNKGIGLSAPQIGLHLRVITIGNYSDPESVMTLFNPNIVDFSKETCYLEEGCLSFPGLYVKISRSNNIRLRYQGMDGKTDTGTFSGLTARIIQHECDHLEGVLFTKRASYYHLEKAKKDLRLMNRKRKKNVHNSKISV